MKKLKKETFLVEYDKVKQSTEKFNLDKNIERTVHLLMIHGYVTTLSCEGHLPGNGHVDAYRQFWPYIQIKANRSLEIGSWGVIDVEANPFEVVKNLETLLHYFNHSVHPYVDKQRLEMDFLVGGSISEPINIFRFHEGLKKEWNILGMICDQGVAGIQVMPQELITDSFRIVYLQRTQDHMKRFTEYLEWSLFDK